MTEIKCPYAVKCADNGKRCGDCANNELRSYYRPNYLYWPHPPESGWYTYWHPYPYSKAYDDPVLAEVRQQITVTSGTCGNPDEVEHTHGTYFTGK